VNDGDEAAALAHFSRDAPRAFQRAQWWAHFGSRGVAIMMAIFGRFFHWPTSAERINAEASRLLHENSGRALFRALECELDAHDNHDPCQAHY
jgi:TnpA family transposase